MLARANRITDPEDFRTVVRRGRRAGASRLAVHYRREEAEGIRLGFIVGKAVGGAVTRNLVRRRLREAGREALVELPAGSRVVVRALPPAASAGWTELRGEFRSLLAQVVRS